MPGADHAQSATDAFTTINNPGSSDDENSEHESKGNCDTQASDEEDTQKGKDDSGDDKDEVDELEESDVKSDGADKDKVRELIYFLHFFPR